MSHGLIAFPLILAMPLLVGKRLLRYLHYLQLDDYETTRFLSWIWKKSFFDRRGSILLLLTGCALLFAPKHAIWQSSIAGLGSLLLLLLTYEEPDPRSQAKIPLKMTKRAKRIYGTAYLLFGLVEAIVLYASVKAPPLLWILQIPLLQATPLWLVLSTLLLLWGEHRRQRHLLRQASLKLKEVDPLIIGITGSYGKTSCKEALREILQIGLGPTFAPPKSINSPMGITRQIREELKLGTRYAIFEMGAYRKGSIATLCSLTPPQVGWITTIGQAHLERFGSERAILEAKSELAQAIPDTGILLCFGDDKNVREIAERHRKEKILFYGFEGEKGPLDAHIEHWRVTHEGTHFSLRLYERRYEGCLPQWGKPALANAVGALTLACALGCDPDYGIAILRNLTAVEHRLQLLPLGENMTLLKDGYNSNPVGFESALEVLDRLSAKRRILMTPGMIELGPRQHTLNSEAAMKAAKICDWILLVGEENRSSLLEGLKRAEFPPERILHHQTRDDAWKTWNRLHRPGDALLVENDLTDLYEPLPPL